MSESELHDLFVESARTSIEDLKGHYRNMVAQPAAAAADLEAMAQAVHVLKGQGSSFGFPLITSIGTAMMTLLKGRESVDEAFLSLLEVYVDALALIINEPIQGDGGELGDRLIKRLEALTAELG